MKCSHDSSTYVDMYHFINGGADWGTPKQSKVCMVCLDAWYKIPILDRTLEKWKGITE